MRRSSARRGEHQVEMLEGRRLLSVTATQTGDLLEIKGDAEANVVRVFDSNSNPFLRMVVSIDANGNGYFADPGDLNNAIFENVGRLVVRLGLGNDSVEITAADPLTSTSRDYQVTLGTGNDRFQFTNPVGNDIRDSNVDLTVNAGAGEDELGVALNRVVNSRFWATVTAGLDDDSLRIYGGDDIANSDVSMNVRLGDGNDRLVTALDWEGFDLIGATSRWSITAWGGAGNDVLSTEASLGNSAADVYGTLAFNYQGEDGWDQVDLRLDRFTLRGGTLAVRGNGGANGDSLSLSANIGQVGGGVVDAALRGSIGIDRLVVNATADPSLSYAAGGGVIVDGGSGFDTATVQGTLPVVLLGIEG